MTERGKCGRLYFACVYLRPVVAMHDLQKRNGPAQLIYQERNFLTQAHVHGASQNCIACAVKRMRPGQVLRCLWSTVCET